jgi:type IV pilus assembly protein PilB
MARGRRITGWSEAELRSKLLDFLSKQHGVPAISLVDFDISPEVIALIPRAVAVTWGVIPVNVAGDTLVVATEDPSNVDVLDAMARYTGYRVEPVVAASPDIDEAISRYYSDRI